MANNQNGENCYSYSIRLTSFIYLYDEPFTKQVLNQKSFNNSSIIQVGVLGNANCGKTSLINDISISCQAPLNSNIIFNADNSNTIYYKSVGDLLFMKAPSMNDLLINLEKYSFPQLVFDRLIMKKFIIGYFSWFSPILIIVVDSTSETDYEKYYYDIKQMRKSFEKLYIIHNISKYNEKNKSELFVKLENDKLYNKNTFLNLKLKMNSTYHYYVDTKDTSLIHLIYWSKTDDNNKDTTKVIKEKNKQMIEFLRANFQICQTKRMDVKKSFDQYLEAFASQLYEGNFKECIKSTEKESRLIKQYSFKHISDSFININVFPQKYIPSYQYHIETKENEKQLIIDFNLPTYVQFKAQSCTVIGDENVIKLKISFEKQTINANENEKTLIYYSNLIEKECEFKISIPTSICVIISNKQTRKEKNKISFRYTLLQDTEEENLIFDEV